MIGLGPHRMAAADWFGSLYDDYARRTPRFLPHLHAPAPPLAGSR